MQFKEGDVVRLKSGGPNMTIYDTEDADSLKCEWFVGSDLKMNVFSADVLDHASGD